VICEKCGIWVEDEDTDQLALGEPNRSGDRAIYCAGCGDHVIDCPECSGAGGECAACNGTGLAPGYDFGG
jgi:hypothetical protein